MSNGIIKILAIILFFLVAIYIIKNRNKIHLKHRKILIIFGSIIVIGMFLYFFQKEVRSLYNNIESITKFAQFDKYAEECDENMKKANEYYGLCMNEAYEPNYDKPYLLEDFSYVEGTWDTGFVIEDEKKNQFVWVPVSNQQLEHVAKLVKKDLTISPLIAKEECFDENYENFIKSALNNGGFYISRYELGIENDQVVSKANKKLLSYLTKEEVKEKIEGMYENVNFSYELVNGYAYDTMIEWIRNDEEVEVFDIDVDKEVLTGRNSNKNIFDVFDNILEYTRRN